ncbi:MAG: class I mannose-6-phosphate isomerase, partial [Verrucomicrobiae bacterium]|nr:class I mannose-6-phosphate isomerase [Verrucomicrobiae bacterium]MDW7979580.1 class I mannose-6-phosphate isomerase [Verrucomicrobiales bacterium]
KPIGESWEIADRPGDVSVIANGALAGRDLHWLLQNHRAELLGAATPHIDRFPLLIKILDAADRLSLQVHPPPNVAAALGGEPKTEMWYVAHAAPGAELFVGLRNGITRAEFERRLHEGTVADCFHRVSVRAGDAVFLPAGRVHAIGAGIVIFEIQQNSDTTYRVFDWNRLGLDGRPRQLHIAESLQSINFNDFEPRLIEAAPVQLPNGTLQTLVRHELFNVEVIKLQPHGTLRWQLRTCLIIGVVEGELDIEATATRLELNPGDFCLVPACAASAEVHTPRGATFLKIEPGHTCAQ